MDHREIAVRVPVMNEVQFPFPSELIGVVEVDVVAEELTALAQLAGASANNPWATHSNLVPLTMIDNAV